MSESGNDAGASATASGPAFTEREMQMLAWAMQSLKSGPPDVDYEKLAQYAGMTNPRSAGNSWAKIRNKLNAATAEGGVATPKKSPLKKKKAAVKAEKTDDDADGEPETPKKPTPRKRTPKKQEVDGEGASPKKRGRPAAPKDKKSSDEEQAAAVKAEDPADHKGDEKIEDADDDKPEATPHQEEI
ncbi:hypothetical protein PMIN06_002153 [Paraphaeosphaeria minitans]